MSNPDRNYGYGPTKRSADVNDYTALEAEVARGSEENAKLRAQLDAAKKRERALLWRIKRLDAIAAVDRDLVSAFVAASKAAPSVITQTTPYPAIDAAMQRRRLAMRIADAVAAAVVAPDATIRRCPACLRRRSHG